MKTGNKVDIDMSGIGGCEICGSPEHIGFDCNQKQETYDFVNHPKHYNLHSSGVECIDIVEHMTFNVGTAVKYCWRAGFKPEHDLTMSSMSRIRDLEKARWYLDREIQKLKKKMENGK